MCLKDSGKTSELTPGPRAGVVPIPTKPQLPKPHVVQVGAQELDLKCSFFFLTQDTEGSGNIRLLHEPRVSGPMTSIVG